MHPATNSVYYKCHRRQRGITAEFEGEYRPVGDGFRAEEGSLEQFLVERYCLYAVKGRRLYRADIHHVPWTLQPAHAEIQVDTMASAAGISLPRDVLLHYAHTLQVLVWGPERLL